MQSLLVYLALGCGGSTATPTLPTDPGVPTDTADTDVPRPAVVLVDEPVGGGFPHLADHLYPRGVSPQTRAIVVLHGGGGTKEQIAYSLGIKDTEEPGYDDGYLATYLEEHDIALIFVQGRTIASQPATFTWSNTIMTSGADDGAMLAHLADQLRTEQGFERVFLMGHSMGGSMTNRMWCEQPESFAGYGSSAGPMSNDLWATCTPTTFRPYLHVTGLNDRVLQIVEDRLVGPPIDHSGELTLTLESTTRLIGRDAFVHAPPEFRNELLSYPLRVQQICGATAAPPVDSPANAAWTTRTHSDCNGAVGMVEVRYRDHCQGGAEAAGARFCDAPLTPLGTTEHLDRFVEFFARQ